MLRACHGPATLACMLAVAVFVILLYITLVEKMGPDDIPDEFNTILPAASSVFFDLKNFSYLIEPPNCSDKKFLAVLLVTSHFEHVELRSAHRRGYPESILKGLGIRRLFLLASPPSTNDWKQGAIQDEARRFNDILQGNFIEAYRHLTYKNTMGLLWAARNCSRATFIAKMDDDIAVNLFHLVNSMRKEHMRGTSSLAGRVIVGSKPQRDPLNKWFLTESEFPEDTFPDYLSGWLYFGRTGLLGTLADHAAATGPYLFIDDVLLLGVVREKVLGSKSAFVDLSAVISGDVLTVRCCLLKPKTECHLMAGPVDHDSQLLLRFVRLARKCSTRGACLPPPKKVVSCGTDVRALVEDALASVDESRTGVASAVPI